MKWTPFVRPISDFAKDKFAFVFEAKANVI